ncbi:fimbrial protein [Acinetobacter sp. 1125_18A]|jgi:major type 1 subunit fimbrin (pilin)|uniref:fimbrial protein n=1 Tax=Acinetobacter sp. 1125_18A TaxID=2605959 RepID=UPI004057F08C
MQKLTLATLSTLALTLACTQVFAVDGTITVNGVITDGTCTLRAEENSILSGLKDLTVSLPTLPKSTFTPSNREPFLMGFNIYLRDATGSDFCDIATRRAFRGIYLSAISPDHLDTTDKTLLLNKASGASVANPVFIQFYTVDSMPVDFSASWEAQAKSTVQHLSSHTFVYYRVQYASKTGIVNAQTVQAKINYTLMYN